MEKLAQSPGEIFMVRPANFCFNVETAVTNHYQDKNAGKDARDKAVEEFDQAINTLSANEIKVTVFKDSEQPIKPDAIFPNNWISMHQSGEVILYPMATPNRRLERREDIVKWLKDNFQVTKIVDISHHEDKGKFLEGTGSIVFDHPARVAYACLSVRTDLELLEILCQQIGYDKVVVDAYDRNGLAIYHTNVFLTVATDFVIVCLEAVVDGGQRQNLVSAFKKSGKTIFEISQEQVGSLMGNCFEVMGKDGRKKLVMSTRAWGSLTESQQKTLSNMSPDLDIVKCCVNTIESVGGGGIRCTIAPVFNKRL